MKIEGTIIVVDDDESMRNALERLIKSLEIEVKTFASAADYLNCGDLENVICLILDIRMPGMTGLDLQEHLGHSDSQIPIIFITAHEDKKARETGLKGGALAYLSKPFEDEVLIKAIHAALEKVS
ncbi:MAG TPA: response regulator [archaeon]|nr:response regulator [archaeon]